MRHWNIDTWFSVIVVTGVTCGGTLLTAYCLVRAWQQYG